MTDNTIGGQYQRERLTSLLRQVDAEVLAAVQVAKSEMGQCVGERDQARAEVERLRMQYEASQGALTDLLTEHRELRETIEALAAWFESQPNWNGWGIHRQIRALNAAKPTPPATPHAEDGAHDCETCPDCIHDGRKCCGCYDGACCKSYEWAQR